MSKHTCKKCNPHVDFDNYYQFQKHKINVHAFVVTPRGLPKNTTPALERLQTLKLEVSSAIKDLEAEREVLHRRVLELDDIIVKYKKATV